MSGTHPNLVRLRGALAALALAGALAACSSPEQSVATSAPPVPPTQETAPFESEDAFAWLTAACGSPSVMNGAPNGWMPGAQDVRLCLTPIDRPGVLVGVYDDKAASAADIRKIDGPRRYATRQDDEGRTWVFLVDSPDAAALMPLERYGFDVS